jgi:hypothetical protein
MPLFGSKPALLLKSTCKDTILLIARHWAMGTAPGHAHSFTEISANESISDAKYIRPRQMAMAPFLGHLSAAGRKALKQLRQMAIL